MSEPQTIPHVEYGFDEPPHPRCPFNRQATEARFDQLDAKLDEIIGLAKRTNGRVTALEMREAVGIARTDEREKSAIEARAVAANAAKRAAAVVSTLISLGGLLIAAIGLWLKTH